MPLPRKSGRELYEKTRREPFPTINRQQAEALVALLTTGELKGVRYENVEPPKSVALIGVGERGEGLEAITDAAGIEHVPAVAPCNTLGVIADDGRQWQIAGAGITWPQEEK